MTEAEWLACTNPFPMLDFLAGKSSDRKLRLFAVACCRRIWPLMIDQRSRRAVEAAEDFADGLATVSELKVARRAAYEVGEVASGATLLAGYAAYYAAHSHDNSSIGGAWYASGQCRNVDGDATASDQDNASLLCDLFGPLPFRSVGPEPAWLAWRDATIPGLAQAIYEDRELPSGHLDKSRLAILGDALEDAGCIDPDILAHCRQPGIHVRGCWVVDLILGKV
jgi:hypothetical protein